MKKISIYFVALFTLFIGAAQARELSGIEAQRKFAGAEKVLISEYSAVPEMVKFREESQISFNTFEKWTQLHLIYLLQAHLNCSTSQMIK